MNVVCPYSVGHSKSIRCVNGCINEMRCPYWQSYGQVIETSKLLESPYILNSELCGFIPELMNDFQLICFLSWKCTEWQTVGDDSVKCTLIDKESRRWNMDTVVNHYKKLNEGSDQSDEREAPEDFYN